MNTGPTVYGAKLDAAPTKEEIGRLNGKTGLGLLMLLIGIAGPALAPALPDFIDSAIAQAAPYFLSVGAGLAGVGVVHKLRKLGALLRLIADQLDKMPRRDGS